MPGALGAAAAPHENVELKARCPDLATVRRRALDAGARPRGVLEQRDTYFVVPAGRLKLREQRADPGDGAIVVSAELLHYRRADATRSRSSRYRRTPVEDPAAMRALLLDALGPDGEVRKRRELLLAENVRIHLDEVDGLGTFVELEGVVDPVAHPRPGTTARVEHLRAALGIDQRDIVAEGYRELVARATA